jgi:hypothetical protein
MVSWVLLIPSGMRLIVLVVVWPIVSDVSIYDDFLDVYMFCMLHVLYIKFALWVANPRVAVRHKA